MMQRSLQKTLDSWLSRLKTRGRGADRAVTGSAPQATNLVARFVLELCMLTALGYAGFQLGDGIVVSIGLATALPLAVAVLWGVAIAGHEVLGLILAVAVLINLGLMFVWGQRQTA